MLNNLAKKAINGEHLSEREINFLIKYPEINDLCRFANIIKSHFFKNTIEFCSILNAKSGRCSENCKFCAQSAHYKTKIKTYEFIDLQNIENQAKMLKLKGVKRFSIVTSGKSPSEKDFDKIIKAIKIIRKHGLLVDASPGILESSEISRLKMSGLSGFHHNLEVSKSFFKNICTTHDYNEDVQTVKNAVEQGLYVCSGGIFGVGESWEQRIELALTLKELRVHSIPINFLNPIKGTPLETMPPLTEQEALKIVALFRFLLPNKHIRICGGRNVVFDKSSKTKLLECGASGLMVGNYLTTPGFDINSDLKDIKELKLTLM